MKPSFIIAGIMKSGTTYLDALVRTHPQVYLPTRSMEYSFFDNDNVFKKGFQWYESIFIPPSAELVVGQTSADCAFNPGTIDRIKSLLPNVKLIFVVRDPIQRSYSLYWHQVMMGREYLSFERAIELEPKRIKKNYYNLKMYSYLLRSKYKTQFDKIYSVFDKDQILIIPFEQLIKNELYYLNKVFDFIGVDRIEKLEQLPLDKVSKNQARVPRSMSYVRVSAFLQRIGLVRVGRFFLNRFLINERPPKLNKDTELYLIDSFKEDIEFHKSIFDSSLNR
jgi:hypothetical protein